MSRTPNAAQRASLAFTALTLASFAILTASCRAPRAGKTVARLSFPGAPLVLICIDTLRSDHLPFYGYRGLETPALAALRDDSILFERAYAHVPLTLASHATIFTGELPNGHGIHDNLGYRLSPSVPTLAELLKARGYRTGAAVSSIVMNGASGISRGFDLYDDAVEPTKPNQPISRVQRTGDEAEEILGNWLGRATRKPGEEAPAPFFAFLHLYEPHSPYEPPEPFKSRYQSAYDGEIAAADALVGRFLKRLKEHGLYDPALIVFFSDHGEGLGDHGENEHGVFLYREALQVPLLVKLPKRDLTEKGIAKTVSSPVALSDIFATCVKALEIKTRIPQDTLSLIELAQGAAPPARRLYAETFFPRIHFGWSELTSLLDERWHYIEAPRPEFFDLVKDNAQKEDLAPRKSAEFRAMRAEMAKRKASFQAPAAADPELAKKLASLGYLSTGATAGPGPLPDPKDQIHVVTALKETLGNFFEGRHEEAVRGCERLLEENPRMLDVWDLYSKALLGLGRYDESLRALKKTIELSPGSSTYLLEIANLSLQIGKPEEAQKNAELARDMGDPMASEVLARALLARRDFEGARRAAEEAVARGRNAARAEMVLAKLEIEKGELAKALQRVDRVKTQIKETPIAGLHHLRADILARLNRMDEAEREFLEEIRRFPKSLDARNGLAILYAASERRAKARSVLQEMVTNLPAAESYVVSINTLRVIGDKEGLAEFRRRALALYPNDPRLNGKGTS